MRKLAFALILVAALLLTGIYVQPAAAQDPTATPAGYTGPLAAELNVYNWGGYIDETLLDEYTETYGVTINYSNFVTQEEMFSRMQAGQVFDVIFPTDYMIDRLIQLEMIAPLNKDNIPNFANVDPLLLDTWYDPGGEYCAPSQWGVSGIGYVTSLDRAPDSWAALFDPEQAAYYDENGGINLLDDPRELIGATLQYLGYSGNDDDLEHLNQARDALINVLPYVKYINASDYMDTLLPTKEVVISHSWDGPVLQAARATATEENPAGDWAFMLPKEGGFRWQDGLCIPSNSPSKDTAEHFINFLLSAEAGVRIAARTGYLTANVASRALIPEDQQGFNPTAEQVAKLEWFRPLSDEALQLYDQVWTEFRASQ